MSSEGDGREVVVGAVDPGGTSGWGLVWVPWEVLLDGRIPLHEHVSWDCGEFSGDEDKQATQLISLIQEFPEAAWVFEDFHIRTTAVELSPVRITAKVQFGLYTLGLPRIRFFQNPDLAMTTVTDIRQKRWGLWEKGKEHGRDGIKHALTFARRCQNDSKLREAAYGRQPR